MALTKIDFETYKVNDVLARREENAGGLSAYSYWSVCGDERERYKEAGDETGAELFGLLADVSSMGFWGGERDPEQPFSPMWTGLIPGKRSCLPEDFTEADLNYLAEIVCDIEEAVLRAQIADVLWVRKHGNKRGSDNAVIACKAYLKSIHQETLTFWMEQRLERALQISKLLNKPDLTQSALELATEIADTRLNTGEVATWSRMTSLLATHSERNRDKFSEQIWAKAVEVEEKGDSGFATRLREMALKLFKANKNSIRAREAQLNLVKILIDQAAFEAASGNYGRAHSLIEQAITHNTKAEGPKCLREKLALLLTDYGKKSYESTDWQEVKIELPQEARDAIEEIARDVTEMVKGKSLKEALYSIVVSKHPVDAKSLKSQEQELLRTSIAPHIASFSVTNEAGKVVNREWPFAAGRLAMNFRMLHIGAVVQPAIKQINDERKVNLDEIVGILEQSLFVPQYSRWTFATGILAGFKFDLVTVAHVLLPMLENAFREVLTAYRIDTARLDENLVSHEKSLSWILNHQQFEKILDEDLLFDLRSLILPDEGGLNLRNNVTHGLLGDSSYFLSADGKQGQGPAQILYLWWLTVKLCLFHQAVEHFEGQSNQSDSKEND